VLATAPVAHTNNISLDQDQSLHLRLVTFGTIA